MIKTIYSLTFYFSSLKKSIRISISDFCPGNTWILIDWGWGGDKAQLRRLSVFIATGTSLFFEGTRPFEELLLVLTRKSDAKRF